MLTNTSSANLTYDPLFNSTMAEIRALRKIKFIPQASYALTQFLQHTDEEAEKIIADPVYTDSDMKLIAAIGPMLAGDLNLVIDSFYTDIIPKEPASCVEVFNRMVESFPSEPIVLVASNGNHSIFENGPNVSRGLIRRLLRAKQFAKTCEDARLETQSYYHAVWADEKERLAEEYRENAVLVYTQFEVADSAMSTNRLDATANTFYNFIAMSKQNDLVAAVVALSFFGICAVYSLRRPANCLRKGVTSILGLFKPHEPTFKELFDEENARVFSV